MSSSGHGQSVVRSADKIEDAWNEAQTGRRAHGEGDVSRVIIEQLVDLDYELTMLTVSSSAGIVVCEPIGQRQESGDYRDSWQPAAVEPDHRQEVKRIATQAVQGLIAHAGTDTAWGVFGAMLLREDVGGYVLVAVVSFAAAVVVTVFCTRLRKNNKQQEQTKEDEET